MCQRLEADDDQKIEDVVKRLDEELAVRFWGIPGGSRIEEAVIPEREPGAPDWWYGEEDASASFLKAQGVVL